MRTLNNERWQPTLGRVGRVHNDMLAGKVYDGITGRDVALVASTGNAHEDAMRAAVLAWSPRLFAMCRRALAELPDGSRLADDILEACWDIHRRRVTAERN